MAGEANKIVAYTHIAAHKTKTNEHFMLNLYSYDSMLSSINKQNPPSCPVATGAGRMQTRPRIAL